MGNSISTTSNAATNATPATLKAGDAVLWAAVSNDTYQLQASSDQHSKRLVIHHANIEYSFDADGRSSPDDALPSLFHDTPANRQAINTLYGNAAPSPCKVIDTTTHDDKEVIVLSSHDLLDIACDINGAAIAIDDIGHLLSLIYRGEIKPSTAMALARLTHDSTSTWAELLHSRLEGINDTLAMTIYGKEGAQ